MKLFKGLVVMLVAAAAMPALPAAAQNQKASAFVQKLADDAVDLLQSGKKGESRDAEFRALMARGFDVGFLGRQALGRYWRTASESERQTYQTVFKDYMLRTITSRLSRFEHEKLNVTGQRPGPRDDTVVESQIVGDGEPIAMEWLVRPMDDGLKIIDVKLEGVSMLITTRDEFGSIVQSKGVQGLLDAMKAKIEVMKAQSDASG
ncbi:MAG: ABC transporter substrate-binding protein [Alphaproteobacteria bacterium]|nr:ABC transporter substrate-binding protein [Alphaproteobacteria bacterium]